MNQRPFHVLIIGGGIGGLCLAQGLKRAGISVAVYERESHARCQIAGLSPQHRADRSQGASGVPADTRLEPPGRKEHPNEPASFQSGHRSNGSDRDDRSDVHAQDATKTDQAAAERMLAPDAQGVALAERVGTWPVVSTAG
jgi:flavin-dependent dehydrogenase